MKLFWPWRQSITRPLPTAQRLREVNDQLNVLEAKYLPPPPFLSHAATGLIEYLRFERNMDDDKIREALTMHGEIDKIIQGTHWQPVLSRSCVGQRQGVLRAARRLVGYRKWRATGEKK